MLCYTKTFTIEKAYCWLVRYFYFIAYAQYVIDASFDKDNKLQKYEVCTKNNVPVICFKICYILCNFNFSLVNALV